MIKFAINGRIFEYPITGVGRFCYETITAMDQLVDKGECTLLVPITAKNVPKLSNIAVETIGSKGGIYWEQVELPMYLRRNNLECLSMSSSLPILRPGYVLIHDISLKVNRNISGTLKDKLKIWWPLLQYRTAAKHARVLFTDTEFQRNEFVREYGLNGEEITVVYAGWQHMERICEDDGLLQKYNLLPGSYFFAVSTRAKNKNFRWVYEVAKRNPESTFVVAGKLDTKYFSDKTDLDDAKNIITTGYVSDEQMKSLMKNCKAFLYPSFYEGFGIPPIEALSVGTKVIISRASCLPEVYRGTAYYIDPYDYDINISDLLKEPVMKPDYILERYAWKKTAKTVLTRILQAVD